MDGNGDTIGVWEPEELDFELSTDNDNFEIEVQQQFIDIFHKAIQQDLVSITHIAGNHSDTIAESNSAPTIGNTEIPVST